MDLASFRIRPFVHGHVAALQAIRASSDAGSRDAYLGVLGHDNLGDELLFQVASRAFPSRRLIALGVDYGAQRYALRTLVRRGCGIMIGGGTLLLSRPMLNAIEGCGSVDCRVSTFGSGVLDPEFWGRLSERDAARWRAVLSRIEVVGVRGPRSVAVLGEIGVTNAVMVGDPAVTLLASEPAQLPEEPLIGVNFGTANGRIWGGREDIFRNTFAKSIRELASRGWKIRYFCLWPSDLQPTRELMEIARTPNSEVICEYRDPYEFQTQAKQCRLFVALKLHATILSVCAGVPTLAIEYQPKVADFMESIDCGTDVVRTDTASVDQMVEWVSNASRAADVVAARQRGGCVELQKRFHSYLASIRGE